MFPETVVGIELQRVFLPLIQPLHPGPRPTKAFALVPWNLVDPKPLVTPEHIQATIALVPLPANPEAKIILEFRLGQTIAEGGDKLRFFIRSNLDVDHIK